MSYIKICPTEITKIVIPAIRFQASFPGKYSAAVPETSRIQPLIDE